MARAPYRKWTAAEEGALIRLFDEGNTVHQIAKQLSRPVGSVATVWWRLGLNLAGLPHDECAAERRAMRQEYCSTDRDKQRRRDYMRDYMRMRRSSPHPGVTP